MLDDSLIKMIKSHLLQVECWPLQMVTLLQYNWNTACMHPQLQIKEKQMNMNQRPDKLTVEQTKRFCLKMTA